MATTPVDPPSLEVLHYNLADICQQLSQAATQAKKARFHGAPTIVDSMTDACALSEVAGSLEAASSAVRMAEGLLAAHLRELDRRVAQDGRA